MHNRILQQSEDYESDSDLVNGLERARQRIEAVRNEFKEATSKLSAINGQINSASDRYFVLSGLNVQLADVNSALETATIKLAAITDQILVAEAKVEHLQEAKRELSRVNEALEVATDKLSVISRELKAATDHVAKLKDAKRELEAVNLKVTQLNMELYRVNRDLKVAHQAAVQGEKLKTEFLNTVSHEIRTPMSGMIAMCEMLLLNNLDESSREAADAILTSANDLLLIVNQLLDLSKLEAGKMEPEQIKFSIAAVIDKVVSLIRPETIRKGLTIGTTVAPSIPAFAVGDEVRFHKILLNLACNAVKFTDCGEIVLAAESSTRLNGRVMVRMSVTDTGIGIAEETQKRLFEPFVQADSSTTRKYGGSGLALSITKRLVILLGGEIGVTSTEGKGSTFWFTVPLKPA